MGVFPLHYFCSRPYNTRCTHVYVRTSIHYTNTYGIIYYCTGIYIVICIFFSPSPPAPPAIPIRIPGPNYCCVRGRTNRSNFFGFEKSLLISFLHVRYTNYAAAARRGNKSSFPSEIKMNIHKKKKKTDLTNAQSLACVRTT